MITAELRLKMKLPPLNRSGMLKIWKEPGGYREAILLAWPLVLSSSSSLLLQLIDRIFLSWHSEVALSAAASAGMFAWTLQSFFVAVFGYTAVFVAQYFGAKRDKDAVKLVCQAIFVAIFVGILIMLLAEHSSLYFSQLNHEKELMDTEKAVARVLIYGSMIPFLQSAIAGYFIGYGRTNIVLIGGIIAMVINIILGYLLIFGVPGILPSFGAPGAAFATVIAQFVATIFYFVLFLKKCRETPGCWEISFPLVKRLFYYGAPNGVYMMLEAVGWTLTMGMIGGISTSHLSASTLAFQLNAIAWLPIMGFSMGTAAMVGQYVGAKKVNLAVRSFWSNMHISLALTLFAALLFIFIPDILLLPFGARGDATEFAATKDIAVVLLRYVAVYCIVDSMYVVSASTLRGAGDVKFVMLISVTCSTCLLTLPVLAVSKLFAGSPILIHYIWIIITVMVLVQGVLMFLRVLSGKWKDKSVINENLI